MEEFKQVILIVDDSKEYIQFLTAQLDEFYTIITAADGEMAISRAKEDPRPDLILLDILMPGLDGYEVCQKLKEEEETNHIPILFLSALSNDLDKLKGLSLGALDFITKPFDIELIKIRIKNQLELTKYQGYLNKKILKSSKESLFIQTLLIESLGKIAEYHDPGVGNHLKRTQNYVKALAEELMNDPEFDEEISLKEIKILYQTVPLHDIGKIGVPESILLKPGKLTNNEFDEIKKHAYNGYKILQNIMENLPSKSFLKFSMDIAYTHHEKWDGSGYPNGLREKNIPLSGRLMAIADVYDALISKKCYREPFSHEKAIKLITKEKGIQFDPYIVSTFLNIEHTIQNIANTYDDYKKEIKNEEESFQEITEKKDINNILVVDDNEINLEIIQSQIESLGYSVSTALSGSIALKLLENNEFDLVLTDLDMPEMNGYELTKKIHQLNPQIPVIAETASDYELTPEKFRNLDFSGYLLKTANNETIKSKLENLKKLSKNG
ncbi:MAG: response regulator [bacterium]|nr:response regulator [bacterium]